MASPKDQIIAYVQAGGSITAAAKIHNISRQRVSQITRKAGIDRTDPATRYVSEVILTTREKKKAKAKARAQIHATHLAKLRTWGEMHKAGKTWEEIGKEFGVHSQHAWRAVTAYFPEYRDQQWRLGK